MSILEVRNRFHALIDEVENPLLLQRFFELMHSSKGKSGQLWDNLSKAEQSEVISSFEESKEEANLVSHEVVMNKHKKWRKK